MTRLAWEYGPMDLDLQTAVNRRLADGWFVVAHEITPPERWVGGIPYGVFILGDQPPSDDIWIDPDVIGKAYNWDNAQEA